jgi:hypothetical protein
MIILASMRAGGLLAKFMLLLAASALALGALFFISGRLRERRQCVARLTDIHRALQLYEIERGTLPNLAFYPDDPREGPDGLRGALEHYGVEYETCVCPGEPKVLRETGQTYLWNAALSAQKMPRGATSVWMLVEASALSGDVPTPHWGGYHVLFSDGHVGTVRDPHHDLPGL